MTPEQFCYWLQGYAKLNIGAPNEVQWVCIKQHLDTVFEKVTPPGPGTEQFHTDFLKPPKCDEGTFF